MSRPRYRLLSLLSPTLFPVIFTAPPKVIAWPFATKTPPPPEIAVLLVISAVPLILKDSSDACSTPPAYCSDLLRVITPPDIVNVPKLFTPPPYSFVSLSVIAPPDISNVPFILFTPPPSHCDLFWVIVPPDIVNASALLYTPPPDAFADIPADSLPVIVPPDIVNVPLSL